MKRGLIARVILYKSYTPVLFMSANLLISPLSFAAAIHEKTVDLSIIELNDGDAIITSDKRALTSLMDGGTALQLGDGSIAVTVNNDENTAVYGVYLGNKQNNDFGNGTSINVNHTTTDNVAYTDRAVSLLANTSMSANALKITMTTTTIAQGISAISGGSVINLGRDSELNISGKTSAVGITVDNLAQIIASGLKITANANTGYAFGISAANSTVDLGKNSQINLSARAGSVSQAIELKGNSILTADNLQIETENGRGIGAGGTSSINLGTNSSIISKGAEAIAINGTDVNFRADKLYIKTTGDHKYGMNLNNGTHNVNLGNDTTIITKGDYAHGIWLIGRADAVLTANRLTIAATGAAAQAIEARSGTVNINNSSLSSAKGGTVVVMGSGKGPVTVNVDNSQLVSGGSYLASAQGANTVINLTNMQGLANRNDGMAYAIWAVNGGQINLNNAVINTTDNLYGIVANGNKSKVTLAGAITIKTADTVAMIASDANTSITGSAVMRLNGDLAAQKTALLDLTMLSGSYWKGSSIQSSDGIVNLAMDNSLWSVSGNSKVNNLALINASQVVFDSADESTLTVNNLSGNGVFVMRADVVAGVSDLLNVTGTTAGQHKVQVPNRADLATDGSEVLTIITTEDGAGHFSMVKQTELGGYVYDLRKTVDPLLKSAGNDWELFSTGEVTKPAEASANFLNASYLMGYAETQTLYQRMGDLRQYNDLGNVWGRVFHGNFDSLAHGKLSHFDMSYRGVQMGVDKVTSIAGGQLFTGIFAGLTDSKQHYQAGDGKIKSSSVGLYASYLSDTGGYIDGLVKYQHYRNKLDIQDSQGGAVTGRGRSDGLSASLEAGYRFYLAQQKSGIYVEPQLQLSYGWQDNATVTNSNGLKVDLASYHSLIGRAGVLFGYQASPVGKAPVNFYVKQSWQEEFKGQTEYHLNGAQEAFSFKGGAWVSGVGISTKVYDYHTFFLDMEKTNGKRFNQSQINLGYRLAF